MLAGGALNSYTEFDQQIYHSTATVRINSAMLIYFGVSVGEFLIICQENLESNFWAGGTCQRDDEKVAGNKRLALKRRIKICKRPNISKSCR